MPWFVTVQSQGERQLAASLFRPPNCVSWIATMAQDRDTARLSLGAHAEQALPVHHGARHALARRYHGHSSRAAVRIDQLADDHLVGRLSGALVYIGLLFVLYYTISVKGPCQFLSDCHSLHGPSCSRNLVWAWPFPFSSR